MNPTGRSEVVFLMRKCPEIQGVEWISLLSGGTRKSFRNLQIRTEFSHATMFQKKGIMHAINFEKELVEKKKRILAFIRALTGTEN